MLAKTLAFVAMIFVAHQASIQAKQLIKPQIHGRPPAVIQANVPGLESEKPASGLSSIDVVAEEVAIQPTQSLEKNRNDHIVIDPLQALIEDSEIDRTTWIQRAGIERWTRHPGGAAAISLGVVLLGYSILRMMGGRSTSRRPGRLPRQVIELVGFVPLSSRQQLQLVRLGSKLVLVAVTNNGAEPLAEVTDPVEVDQILAACQSGQSALASAIGRWTGRQSSREQTAFGNRRSARTVFEA